MAGAKATDAPVHAESSTMARSEDQEDSTSSRISIHLPTSFVVLPPVAGLIGLGIGMSRGGSRARLRFLAENAHRPPTTYRGWARAPQYLRQFS